ncbi:hypothetical protein F7R01_10145 [Pseudomonas argentinensis]|uniref:Uncharacterized protein n=1 Tax=Phytopseudomonas argentinensis TaxID=289370 RepID=A0A1I3I8K3_9GAMM|nr:hypothetical protein [Pseudomonas argentinensis]KAB0547856.1 hypothetical protein F7R01_10145 [Pseudomonas argentinensis]SFI44219.1 hypothetical protein SAMN05216602_1498 [Pseudomonas argentinensis]
MKNSQRGSGHLFSLMVLGLIVWGAYVTLYVPYEHRKSMDAFRSNPPAVSPAKMAVIDSYKAKSTPTELPHGLYTGKVEQDGYPMTISFEFGDNQVITKKAHIKNYQFTGSARYAFNGAVMTFSEVKGDAVLFPQPGEPLEVISDTEIHVPGPDKALVLTRP